LVVLLDIALYALRIPQVERTSENLGSKLNPMLRVPLERIVEAEDTLLKVLEDYRSLRMAM
jgi:hypothetical protein